MENKGQRLKYSAAAVKKAADSNSKLQEAIKAEIRRVQAQLKQNRQQAAAIVRAHSHTIAYRTHSAATRPTGRAFSRAFFEDRKRKPELNSDAKRRRAYNGSFTHAECPPWRPRETKALQNAINEEEEGSTSTGECNYELVQQRLAQNLPRVVRSVEEIEVQHQRMKELPLSAQEVEQITIIVNREGGSTDANWNDIAGELSQNRSQPCTPFQCLAAYNQQREKSVSSTQWTLEEDKLLFKYLVAAGPQTVLDMKHPLVEQLQHLLPTKTKTKILLRANTSLLNPSFVHGDWTNTEERALAIYMKIYNNDFHAVASHLHRNFKSVADKWDRSLNPEYSTKPFTKEEDAALIEIVRSNPQCGWTAISVDHFPHRHPHRLANRWSEVATDKDIVDREKFARNNKGNVQGGNE